MKRIAVLVVFLVEEAVEKAESELVDEIWKALDSVPPVIPWQERVGKVVIVDIPESAVSNVGRASIR